MNKKYSCLEESELLDLTDADLEGVYGGGSSNCGDYPYDDDNSYPPYYSSADSWTNAPQSSGWINIPIESQNTDYSNNTGLLSGLSVF